MLDNYLKATETYELSKLEIGDHLQINILQEQTESHTINNTISGTYRWFNGKGTLQVQSCESDLKHHAQTMVLTVLLSRPPDSITEHTTPRIWPGVPWMMQFVSLAVQVCKCHNPWGTSLQSRQQQKEKGENLPLHIHKSKTKYVLNRQ